MASLQYGPNQFREPRDLPRWSQRDLAAARDCRDAFFGLPKTCAKLGIAFWDYLGARHLVPGSATIPVLPEIVSVRAAQPP